MNTVIYALRCPLSNAVRYIGKTKNPDLRLYRHMAAARKLHINHHCARWIRTLLARGMAPALEVLFVVPSDGDWQAEEIKWIANYRAAGHQLTNMTDGGDGVHEHHPDVLEMLRAGSTGKRHTEQAKAKVAAARLGVKHSSDTLAKLRQPRKPLTQAHRENISVALMGIARSPETRSKMSAAKSGKQKSLEHRANMSAARKRYLSRKLDEKTYARENT